MASDAQIVANQRNGALSGGPNTPEGKEKSSQNALRHGLRARTASALGEEDEDFILHHTRLTHALLPRDAYEFVLVRRLAQLSWRLERLSGMEAALLDGVAHRVAAIQARHAAAGDEPPTFETDRPADDLWNPDMPLVARYEATLDRAFSRNMAALECYRASRRPARKEAAAPEAESAAVAMPSRYGFLPNERECFT